MSLNNSRSIMFIIRLMPLVKSWTSLLLHSYGLHSTNTVPLQGQLWHQIIPEGWYVMKRKPNPTKTEFGIK